MLLSLTKIHEERDILVKCAYLYRPETFIDKIAQNHFSRQKLNFKIIDDGTVLPFKFVPGTPNFGGVVDKDSNFLEETFVHHGIKTAYTPTEKIEEIPTPAIYFGMIPPVWGHCITDNLKRAWFFFSETYKNYFKSLPVVYVPYGEGGGRNFAKLLEILEIPYDKFIPVTKPTKFRCIILPDESFFSVDGIKINMYTSEFEDTIDRIRNFAFKNFKPLAQKKFYLFHGRHQMGEERVANYFSSKGYTVIIPENLPLEEQLNIYANCQEYSSSLGSIAHNTIFTRNGTNAIFIPRVPIKSTSIPHQLAINSMRNLNADYLDSTLSIYMVSHSGPYCYIISKQLKKFFGDTFDGYSEDDFKVFLNYVRFSISNKLTVHAGAQEYYFEILSEFMAQLKSRKDLISQFGLILN